MEMRSLMRELQLAARGYQLNLDGKMPRITLARKVSQKISEREYIKPAYGDSLAHYLQPD